MDKEIEDLAKSVADDLTDFEKEVLLYLCEQVFFDNGESFGNKYLDSLDYLRYNHKLYNKQYKEKEGKLVSLRLITWKNGKGIPTKDGFLVSKYCKIENLPHRPNIFDAPNMPSNIEDFLYKKLQQKVKSLNTYTDDNYRAAMLCNPEQIAIYRLKKGNGCCGFCEFEVNGPDGKIYKVGFNYGH